MNKKATVSEINAYIKTLMDYDMVLGDIWIEGEISNFKHHWSGHMYLSLKDENSSIKAVMFKGANEKLKFIPENGMSVLARGRVSVFPRDGQYQLYIEEMVLNGEGDLHVAFEKLKEKLQKEGLFDESRKRALPYFPKTVGIVTSATGAAVRDIINILTRRYKGVNILLYPAAVQGEGAKEEIAKGINFFSREKCADVIIVGRGGGSIEDLWAFNEEIVARAVAECSVPVISAVGHETDFTICDFAADLRAPTPSAAAELAVPDSMELLRKLDFLRQRAERIVSNKFGALNEKINYFQKLVSPAKINMRLDKMSQMLDISFNNIEREMKAKIEKCEKEVSVAAAKLDALSPLKILSRGYSVVFDKDKKILSDAEGIKCGDGISVKLSKGEIECEVTKIKN